MFVSKSLAREKPLVSHLAVVERWQNLFRSATVRESLWNCGGWGGGGVSIGDDKKS